MHILCVKGPGTAIKIILMMQTLCCDGYLTKYDYYFNPFV